MEQAIGSQVTLQLTAGTDAVILPGNPKRRMVVLSGAAGVSVYYGTQAMTAAGQGILVGPNGPPLVLTREQLGEYLTYPIHVFCAAAPLVTAMEGTVG